MINLNNTQLIVSPICLGTAPYGSSRTTDDSHRQLDVFAHMGGNFIDTAHIYGDWANQGPGLSERVIGSWLKEHGGRDKTVIVSKCAHPKLDARDVSRLDRDSIVSDLEGSLSCLATDYIDIYLLHRDDPSVPVIDILSVLENARKQGKIRYYGCSNWKLGRIQEAQKTAKQEGFEGFICNQVMWSLADVDKSKIGDKTMYAMDLDTYSYHVQQGLNAMAYTSVAGGYFTKLLSNAEISADSPYNCDSNRRIAGLLKTSLPQGYTVMDICLLYFRAQPFPAVPIAGFSSVKQLEEGMKAMEKSIPEDFLQTLMKIKTL